MKIGFIGGGHMAEAMIASLRRTGTAGEDIIASDISHERLNLLASRYAIQTTHDNAHVAEHATILVLAVKPQVLPPVSEALRQHISPRHLMISIAAGIRLETLGQLLPEARIVRVMPNLPCQVGFGVSAFCPGRGTTGDDISQVCAILNTFGTCLELPEHAFDAVTALSGSGPAFTASFAEALIRAGEAEGLDREAASTLVLHTLRGATELLITRNITPDALIDQVKSPGGTTAAGMRILESSRMETIVRDTIHAAVERSRELSVS